MECRRCGAELPWRLDGRETRRYCSQVCRQLAYIDRKKEPPMDPDPVALPDLVVEAYGTVTPPPDPEEDEDN